ncbi:hypothetical protein [uncultured Cohaesibacter sp.]|uniref:hypothetical protein n=1 Tax=uncultured Cohaesibacter sp. TaxID=1002546 RepID=UPI0029C8A9E5|nr:hypothetical protein [uncultured Cohaesibacter sp.]
MKKKVSATDISQDEIEQIIALAKDANVRELSIEENDVLVRVVLARKPDGTRNTTGIVQNLASETKVTAIMAARYLPQHPDRHGTLPRVGQHVHKGETLGYLLSGPLIVPLLSPKEGTIGQELAHSNQRVEYGTAILTISEEPPLDALHP